MPIQSPITLCPPSETPAQGWVKGRPCVRACRTGRRCRRSPQCDDDHRDQAEQDHEELHHLVVDGARQAAEQDVGQHEQRRDDDRHGQRDPEQRIQHRGERVQVHAGDQDRGQDEDDRVHQVRLAVVPAPQILGDAADPGAVVERHHHDAEEDHGRHRADPVVVHDADAVLGSAGRHAEDLDRAQIGRDERNPGDPGRERPAGQEEVRRGLDQTAEREPDPDDEDEVDDQQHEVQRCQRQAQRAGGQGV